MASTIACTPVHTLAPRISLQHISGGHALQRIAGGGLRCHLSRGSGRLPQLLCSADRRQQPLSTTSTALQSPELQQRILGTIPQPCPSSPVKAVQNNVVRVYGPPPPSQLREPSSGTKAPPPAAPDATITLLAAAASPSPAAAPAAPAAASSSPSPPPPSTTRPAAGPAPALAAALEGATSWQELCNVVVAQGPGQLGLQGTAAVMKVAAHLAVGGRKG